MKVNRIIWICIRCYFRAFHAQNPIKRGCKNNLLEIFYGTWLNIGGGSHSGPSNLFIQHQQHNTTSWSKLGNWNCYNKMFHIQLWNFWGRNSKNIFVNSCKSGIINFLNFFLCIFFQLIFCSSISYSPCNNIIIFATNHTEISFYF